MVVHLDMLSITFLNANEREVLLQMTELYFFASISPWYPEISPHVECQLSFPAILKVF